MKTIKTTVCLILTLLLLWGCTPEQPAGETTLPTTQATTAPTVPVYEEVENPVRYFSLSMGENYDDIRRMDVYANENGTVHVEYVGQEKKVGDFDANILHGITAAFAASGLTELNGKDIYEEGDANGSMYVEFSDDSMVAVGFSGTVPEAFSQGYAAMDAFFGELTAGLPVYVPQPMILGEVEEPLLSQVLDILNRSGVEALDGFSVSQIAMDDFFGFSAGLSSREGITGAVSCAPMMMTTAYSLVIVTLEEGADAEAVCRDFESNLDWRKWVCVAPSDAMIATKDNMVLCLVAFDQVYTGMANGIAQCGWTEVKTLKNPDL